jgi:hypothetical protein
MNRNQLKIMKLTSFILIIFLIYNNSNVCGQNVSRKDSSFFPLALGNYWIYSNTYKQGADTEKIVAIKTLSGITAFEFNSGYKLMERNDGL